MICYLVCSVSKTVPITKKTPVKNLPLQKQPSTDVYKKRSSEEFLKTYRMKTPVTESLFEEFVGF